MAFKAIIMLTRRDGMSRDEFAEWWLEQHAPLARQLPEVRDARFNLVLGDETGGVDGISELWFDSQSAFEAAYASEVGQRVAADSLANVSGRQRLFVEEHRILEG